MSEEESRYGMKTGNQLCEKTGRRILHITTADSTLTATMASADFSRFVVTA